MCPILNFPKMNYAWRFRSTHPLHGPNRFVPIQVTATPQQTNYPVETYLDQLVRDFRIAIITYIRLYANRIRARVTDAAIDNMQVFIFPISRVNNGREMRRPSGATRIEEINSALFEEVLEQVQSEEAGFIITNIRNC